MRDAFRLDVGRFVEAGRLRLHWSHGVVLLVAFLVFMVAAEMRAGAPRQLSALSTLVIWMPFILRGFALNLVMSFLAMALATVLGTGLGLMRISRSAPARWFAGLVTHLFRNSPWLVILFIVMMLCPFEVSLPGIGRITIPPWVQATFAFTLPVMANIGEIVRGAVNSIPKGQWESAESLAFTRGQTLRWIILPQCVKRAIPPWMNWYALLTMATPMASILGVRESVGNAQAAMEAAGAHPEFLLPFYLFLLCLFFAYIYPISLWTRTLERKYAVET